MSFLAHVAASALGFVLAAVALFALHEGVDSLVRRRDQRAREREEGLRQWRELEEYRAALRAKQMQAKAKAETP